MAIPNVSIPPIDLTGISTDYYSSVQYGDQNREVVDLFIPTGASGSTPLVIWIHGGGFFQGDKSGFYNAAGEAFIRDLLGEDIAFAAANYRLLPELFPVSGGVRRSLSSAVQLIQWLRFNAAQFNLDPTKFAGVGSSAGAGMLMYLAYSDDLSVQGAENPLREEPTGLVAVATRIPQGSYDLDKWDFIFQDLNYDGQFDYRNNSESKLGYDRFLGVHSFEEGLAQNNQDLDFLYLIQENGGVPTRIANTSQYEPTLTDEGTLVDINHNPYHSEAIRNALLEQGTEIRSNIDGLSGDNLEGETEVEFLKRWLASEESGGR